MNITRIVIGLLFLAPTVYAQRVDSVKRFQFQFSPAIGYTNFNLGYSIAGNEQGSNPNILSELKWMNLKGIQYGLNLKGILNEKYFISADYNYSSIKKGTVSDIDYAENNRTSIFFEQYSSGEKSFQQQFNLKIGYTIIKYRNILFYANLGYKFLNQKATLIYSPKYDEQNLIFNAPELNSYYKTTWNSFGIGSGLSYPVTHKLIISAESEFYFSNLGAYGDWNLKKDFMHPKSYIHTGKGFITANTVIASYKIYSNLKLNISYINNYGKINNGIDELYLTNNSISKTKLNKVVFSSNSILLGLNFTL